MIYNCGDVGNSYVCFNNSSQQSEKRTDKLKYSITNS